MVARFRTRLQVLISNACWQDRAGANTKQAAVRAALTYIYNLRVPDVYHMEALRRSAFVKKYIKERASAARYIHKWKGSRPPTKNLFRVSSRAESLASLLISLIKRSRERMSAMPVMANGSSKPMTRQLLSNPVHHEDLSS